MKQLHIEHWQSERRKLPCFLLTLVVASLAACGGSNGAPSAPPDSGSSGNGPVGGASECPAEVGPAVDALAACGGPGVICVGYFDGSTVGNLFPLTTGASPVWSPDGVKIAFHRASDGPSFGIYLINADGTGEQRIADGQQPAWSPEGSKIAFTSSDGISVMNEEGTGVATLIGHDAVVGFRVHAPAWSPDGQQIAYAQLGEDLSPGKIQVMNVDGSSPRQVSPGGSGAFEDYPAWSPSGDRIAFNTFDQAIATVEVSGGDSRLLVRSVAEVSRSAWSPDGMRLAYTANRLCEPSPAIHSVDIEGGPAQVLVRQAREPAWSPDGARLVFVTVGDGAAYQPPGEFPVVSETAEVYVRESLDSFDFLSRYVLFPAGRFELQYLTSRRGYVSYAGSFTRTGADLSFRFDGSSVAGPWEATGVLEGDRLRIEYNIIMSLSDFEDGVYVRSSG